MSEGWSLPKGWQCLCDCHADGDSNCYGCCRGKCTDERNIWKETKGKP